MTTPRDPDRLIHDFLLEGEEQLPDQVYDVVRAVVEQKRQRVFIGPWRTPTMSKLVTYGLGAAAVAVVLFVGAQFFGSPADGGLGSQATPTPTVQPTLQPTPEPTPGATPPSLTQSFTSAQHGYSVSIPEEWTTEAATKPWTGAFPLEFTVPQVDFLYDPNLTSDLFLAIASQPLGDSTPDEWLAEQMASGEGCGDATEPITVDGASGLAGSEGCSVVVVTTGGRGYWIQFYTGSGAPAIDEQAWFNAILATVQLHPKRAID